MPAADGGQRRRHATRRERGDFLIVQAQVLRVHADPRIVVPGSQHIDPGRWSPLVYNFRHYFGLGPELGRTFRSQTPRTP